MLGNRECFLLKNQVIIASFILQTTSGYIHKSCEKLRLKELSKHFDFKLYNICVCLIGYKKLYKVLRRIISRLPRVYCSWEVCLQSCKQLHSESNVERQQVFSKYMTSMRYSIELFKCICLMKYSKWFIQIFIPVRKFIP